MHVCIWVHSSKLSKAVGAGYIDATVTVSKILAWTQYQQYKQTSLGIDGSDDADDDDDGNDAAAALCQLQNDVALKVPKCNEIRAVLPAFVQLLHSGCTQRN